MNIKRQLRFMPLEEKVISLNKVKSKDQADINNQPDYL